MFNNVSLGTRKSFVNSAQTTSNDNVSFKAGLAAPAYVFEYFDGRNDGKEFKKYYKLLTKFVDNIHSNMIDMTYNTAKKLNLVEFYNDGQKVKKRHLLTVFTEDNGQKIPVSKIFQEIFKELDKKAKGENPAVRFKTAHSEEFMEYLS